jgi:hypothetical protein
MLSLEEASAPSSVDERITAQRRELKYLLPGERLNSLLAELSRELPSHRFVGEGANRLPDPNHYVTTIYFDTPSRRNYRAAVGNVQANVKFRAKEYYDLHPSLAELATDPDHIVRYQPWLWFELKAKDGNTTTKQRLRVPKRAVPSLFQSGQVVAESLHSPEFGLDGAEWSGLDAIVQYCKSLEEPLEASCLVNYRRLSFQSADGTLRVTIDLGLSFYGAPADLWTRQRALVRDGLGPPRGELAEAVVEVKSRAATPSWLDRALGRAGVGAVHFSKFVAASGAVHGGA